MEKRIDKIRHKVETEGEVSVTELSELYDVTEETIRRDLEKLKNEGVVTRTFGGLMPVMTNKSPFCGLKPALAFGITIPNVDVSF